MFILTSGFLLHCRNVKYCCRGFAGIPLFINRQASTSGIEHKRRKMSAAECDINNSTHFTMPCKSMDRNVMREKLQTTKFTNTSFLCHFAQILNKKR